jgi:hypothetical protein
MINWKLISNPLNWVTIIVILFIAAFFFHLVEKQFNQSAPSGAA